MRGSRTSIRNPPGFELAHWRGYEARLGYNYRYSALNYTRLHRLRHSVERRSR